MYADIACILEATARKPGNVHRYRDFDDAHYLDFLISAAVLGRHLRPDRVRTFGIGRVVRDAIAETAQLVGHNTNLGMTLLLAPLAGVIDSAELRGDTARSLGSARLDHLWRCLRFGASRLLEATTVADARAVYEAIRLARPGGLGTAPEQDVADEPTVTLTAAMRLAADRDAIARQYATAYEDVFEIGLPALREALFAGRPLETAIVRTHLTLMASRPDTLIARKRGRAAAEESARRAGAVLAAGWPDAPGSVAAIRDLDAWLRADGHARNPGATADLVAATLFAALWDGTIDHPTDFRRPRWDAGDVL